MTDIEYNSYVLESEGGHHAHRPVWSRDPGLYMAMEAKGLVVGCLELLFSLWLQAAN